MQHGSLQNLLMGSGTTTPKVGDGATVVAWTDRAAATIVEVSKSGKTVVAQRDTARRIDKNGMSDCQDYECTPNPNGCRETFTLRANGAWVEKGQPMRGGSRLSIGERRPYFDFSF
jgi:hypothetical protein